MLIQRAGVARILQLCTVQTNTVQATEVPVPQSVQQLLHDYEHLFAEPTGLSPQREGNHAIPLVPGARPVNLRPYRYSLVQKDEVERQVSEMLAQGII